MRVGDPLKPYSQPISKGVLFRIFHTLPANLTDPSYLRGGLTPQVGKFPHASLGANYIGLEAPLATSNAETTWAKKGKFFRKSVRIDKCPWPDGQEHMLIRVTVFYGQTTGSLAASSEVFMRENHEWDRNTTFTFSQSSGTTPSNDIQEGFGFGPGSATLTFTMNAHSVSPGQPKVQDDDNAFSDTFVTVDVTQPQFSTPPDYWYSSQTDAGALPCPQWATHHINFPGTGRGYFLAASFAHGPIGLVMSVSWQIEAVGWNTGFDDDADATGYEYPDYDGSPYNDGVP